MVNVHAVSSRLLVRSSLIAPPLRPLVGFIIEMRRIIVAVVLERPLAGAHPTSAETTTTSA